LHTTKLIFFYLPIVDKQFFFLTKNLLIPTER
jgi:hypothetical protein